MHATRLTAAVLLAAAALAGPAAGSAAADDATASPSATATAGGQGAPTEAGTDFRTAATVQQGRPATAAASTGDYLYWVFPGDSGQNITVEATVAFPASAVRHGPSTWQLDVYDGLRRRQSCRYGTNARTAGTGTASVRLACHLRTVRAWAEPWSNDPLRGSFYVRLTAVRVPPTDLGLPVQAAVEVSSEGTGGRFAVDGSVAPVVSAHGPAVEPSGGWAGTWWSPRWLWTAGGGVLAALAAVGGHRLARGPVRWYGRGGRPDTTAF